MIQTRRMPATDTLIRTRLHLPFTRPDRVPRPRLQARTAEGLTRPLTLITAPAGFGKTTLVASFIAGRPHPFAWLSLDRDDNQVERICDLILQLISITSGGPAARDVEPHS